MLYSCSFLKNIYNHTTKEVNFHVFQIQYWKRWKILNPSSNFVFLLKCCYFFMLSCQKIKIRGWPCRQLVDFFLFFFLLSEALLHFNQNIVSLWCCCWCRGGRFPFSVHTQTETEEGPRRRETRVYSLLLSFSFHSLWCRSSSSLIGAVQSADSPFMADGGRVGSGLLECWHVPIRATVLHYSISARQHTVSPSIANSNHPLKEN